VSKQARETYPAAAAYGPDLCIGGGAPVAQEPKVRTAAQSTILVGELHHRLQNTLSVVLALSRLTARTVNTVEEFQVAFGQRIEAMARTNGLLLQGQVQAVNVQAALEAELLQYLDDTGQVTLLCEPLNISPDAALNLSLIFHELATNAAKHGALAKRGGRLVVTCWAEGLVGHVHWQEFVTQPLPPRLRTGSGSLLIPRLARALGGAAEIDLLPGGLNAKITFRIDAELAAPRFRSGSEADLPKVI
jgi:two-component sensor histidine kinase